MLPDVSLSCIITRAMSKAESVGSDSNSDVALEVLSVSELPLSLSHWEVVQEQRSDLSLKQVFGRVLSASEISSVANAYYVYNDVLFRKWIRVAEEDVMRGDGFQLLVPAKFCPLVLKVAHDECGHFCVQKTYLNILKHFFWPRLKYDVSVYIKSYNVCQLTGKPNQSVRQVPLQPIPVVNKPFMHFIVDRVGPLPLSKSGCKYLLTVTCQCTRYPATYPLRSIETPTIFSAILTTHCRVFHRRCNEARQDTLHNATM